MPPNEPRCAAAVEVAATALRFDRPSPEPRTLAVAVETPVEVAFGDVPFAVMMLTPADLEDFAIGFALTEGVIDGADDIRSCAVREAGTGLRLDVDLAPERLSRHLARRRAISGRTGCGVCGIADLVALERSGTRVAPAAPVALAAIERALGELETRQALNALTHAVHGAAWADRDGAVHHVREDVGRHNALDKLVGALLRERVDPAGGFLLITSRCSFEMVDKAAAFGAPLLVAISAPTSLALARAEALGMGLVAIARRDGVTEFLGASAPDLLERDRPSRRLLERVA